MARSLTAGSPDSGHHLAFERMRAVGAILVVLLHSAIPYIVHPMPNLAWHVRHPQPAAWIDAMFWGIAGFIMPMFLVISGYCAAESLWRRGGSEFLRSRRRRVLLPFIACAMILLPIELYVWLLSWAADGSLELKKLSSLKLGEKHTGLWGFSHLWYLQYLFLYSLLLTGFDNLSRKLPESIRQLEWAPAAVLTAALVASCGLLAARPDVVIGFQHSFAPHWAKFLWCGLFFASGVALAARRTIITRDRIAIRPPNHLALAVLPPALIVGAATVRFMGDSLDGPVHPVALAGWLTLWAAIAVAACWTAAEAMPRKLSQPTRYLAEASFWVYLTHHPLAGIWQLGLRPTEWPASFQMVAVVVGTLACSLGLYETAVRRTAIGQFLNGQLHGHPKRASEPAVPTPAISRAA
jgi:fucose 4-O-acetylase-like acetyltransferase